MTSRSSPNSVTATTSYVRFANFDGSQQDMGSQSLTEKWSDTVTYGSNIPGWRNRLRDGFPTTTQLDGSRIVAQVIPGSLTAAGQQVIGGGGYYKNRAVGALGIYPEIPLSPEDISSSEANSQALGKFNKRIFDVTHSFQGGVVLGELGQTLRMLRNPAQGLRRGVDEFLDLARSIRRRKFNVPPATHLKRLSEHLADAWLEAQFGWKPLMSDIRSANNALAKWDQPHGLQTVRISARAEVKSNHDEYFTQPGWPGFWLTWLLKRVRFDHCMVIYRGAVRVEAKSPAQMRQELLGFDLASFAPTVWELIPYSFLIDYFSNVGDIITGLANLGTRVAWCNKTVILSKHVRTTSLDDPSITGNPGVVVYQHAPATYVCERRLVSRAEYTGMLIPGLDLEIPSLGSVRWLNIAALVASRDADRRWSYD